MRMASTVGFGILAGAVNAASFTVDGNLAAAVSVLVATVLITLATVRWIDGRIEHKLANFALKERWEHHAIVREISALRQLLGHTPLDSEEVLTPKKSLTGE